MLSYRHAFHAGNFADVLKHVVLALALEALRRKDKPFLYLDTHAGAGSYKLRAGVAREHREHENGIARLWSRDDAPAAVLPYLDAVRAANSPGRAGPAASRVPLRVYPGSPRIARHFLRPADRMVLADLHPTDAAALRAEFAGDRQVTVVEEDGYHCIASHLPPHARRGLVLMDPAYELPNELKRLHNALLEGHQRWATGLFMIWYPLVRRLPVERFHARIAASGLRRVLLVELSVLPADNPAGLNGSGLLILNPPWKLDVTLAETLPWLWRVLSSDGAGGHRLEWLVPE